MNNEVKNKNGGSQSANSKLIKKLAKSKILDIFFLEIVIVNSSGFTKYLKISLIFQYFLYKKFTNYLCFTLNFAYSTYISYALFTKVLTIYKQLLYFVITVKHY